MRCTQHDVFSSFARFTYAKWFFALSQAWYLFPLMTDELGWKPPAKEAAAEERRKERQIIRELLTLPDEELFIGALRVLGIADDSPAWHDALEAWRTYQRQRR